MIEQLRRQLRFLARSCKAYDQGHTDEALRIAVTLRVLFHDTKQSTSLLTHLQIKDKVRVLSTMATEHKSQTEGGKLYVEIPLWISREGVKPPLQRTDKKKLITVDEWWNEMVMIQNQEFRRRDVILGAANQDGGAHVDAQPDEKTAELKQGIGTLVTTVNGKRHTLELLNHHFPMIRQFAYEVLNSPDITKYGKDTQI